VLCDISKWKWKRTDDGGWAHWVDATAESIRNEATLVGELSASFPNMSGAFHDDMLGLARRESVTPDEYAEVYGALKRQNPDLDLWVVVYAHELAADEWAAFGQYMDVVNLWVWEAKDLPNFDEYIERARALFPGKPLNLGCYLRDYPTVAPVPMDMVKLQWETLLRHLEAGTVDSYSILAAVLIDGHQEQANWIRDFIAANS